MRKNMLILFTAIIVLIFLSAGTQGCSRKKTAAVQTPVPTNTPEPRMEKIVFTYNGNLLWMDPDGSNRQEIFHDNTSKWFPSVSPDGWSVAYWVQTGKSYNLWIGDLKTKRSIQVTFDSDALDSDVQNFNFRNACAWTADSQFIVYARTNEIWKMKRDGFDQVSLTDTHNCMSPAVSKDNKLVYVQKDNDTTSNLYIKDIDAVISDKLTNFSGKMAGSPVFSPDGQKVLFTVNEADMINLYITDITLRKEEPLTFDGKSNCPIYNHDGNLIIFSSFITDKYQPEIWSMTPDKSNRIRITKDGGIAPSWLCRILTEPLPTPTPVITPEVSAEKQAEIFKIKPDKSRPEQEIPGSDGSLSVRTVKQGSRLQFYPVIQYDTALSNIKPEFLGVLDDMAKIINTRKVPVIIEGYTDNISIKSKLYRNNEELSLARAKSVKAYLIKKHSVDPSRITISGLGDKNPVAPNDTETNRYKNRRAEVMIIEIAAGESIPVTGTVSDVPSGLTFSASAPAAVTSSVMPAASPVKVQVKSKSGKSISW